MAYTRIGEATQARVRASLAHLQGGELSAKLHRALEEDHLARTLLGQSVEAIEARLAAARLPVRPPGRP